MVSAINTQSNVNLRKTEEPIQGQQQAYQVSCRGKAYERVPEYDTYEKKKGHAGGVIAGIVGVLGVGSAIAAYFLGKGKVNLPENIGFFKKVGKTLGEGYKKMWNTSWGWVQETWHKIFNKKQPDAAK